ncbi:MAG: hypothetical protein JXA14_17425 [Anaerolineae bacterium]|jgi:hypothetical protein|nr:hypothetical protein [Anaerolineae bacterium]
MSSKQNSLGALSLLAGWIFASAIGWAAGLAVGVMLTSVATKLPWLNEDRFFAYATLISLGFTTGTAQWIVMGRHLSKPIRWVAGTLIGYLLCLVIIAGGNLARLGGEGVWDDVLLLGLLGTAVGASQWWVLRRHYRKAGLWVLATAVGFLFFLWTIINPSHSLVEHVIRGAIVGTLAAVVPGAMLVYLVRQPLTAVSQGAV